MPYLIAGYTDTLPSDFADTQFVLLAAGLEAYSNVDTVPSDVLTYQIAFVSPETDLDNAFACIRAAWAEKCGTPLALEVIEARVPRMARALRKQLRAMPAGHFSMRAPLAFCAASPEARTEAIENITEAFTRKPWQFWR